LKMSNNKISKINAHPDLNPNPKLTNTQHGLSFQFVVRISVHNCQELILLSHNDF